MRTLLAGPVMSSLEGDPVFGVVLRLVGQRGALVATRKPSIVASRPSFETLISHRFRDRRMEGFLPAKGKVVKAGDVYEELDARRIAASGESRLQRRLESNQTVGKRASEVYIERHQVI